MSKRIKAIIVDDERPARKELLFLLNSFSEILVVGESDNISDAVNLIQTEKPDVVFLDIQLAGETGFDLLENVAITFKLIFVTAYDEFAIRAFEVNATDYLLKPVNPVRLSKTINRIISEKEVNHPADKKFEYDDSIYVKLNNHTSKFIKLNSIIFISSVGNYTKLTVNDGRNYIVLKTLKQWENELPKNHFIRVHHSTIVNMEYINKIEKYSLNFHRVYLKDIAEPIDISRRYAAKLKSNNK